MKKFISLSLVCCLAVSLIAGNIVSGMTYKIVLSSSQGKVLTVKNSSLDHLADVVTWTNTEVNSQVWTVTKTEDNFYQLTNAYSEKNLYRKGNALDGADVYQYNQNDLTASKWSIIPVENRSGYYFITQPERSGTEDLYLEVLSNDEGSAIQLRNKKTGAASESQIWKFEVVESKPNILTADVQQEMMDGWKTKYYKRAPVGYVIANGGWWGDAEMFEVVLDAYETTGNPEYETMFRELYSNFVYRNRANWLYNEYNDDIAWMVIASVRAYLMFGDQTYLTNAKSNFDSMYARALLPSGMLRWKESEATKDGTNSCINGPAEVAACYLAMATDSEHYYTIAKELYALQRQHLYVSTSGQVYDSFTWINGKPSNYNYWASTYNQGTFLGAAVMLYNHFGDEMYKEDAKMIMRYTLEHLCDENDIIKVCQVATGDLAGFKGILMRYVRRFIVDMEQAQYVEWMQKNAMHAYNNRNSAKVSSSAWLTKAPENFVFEDCTENCSFNNDAFGPSTAISVAFNAPLDKNTIIKDAFSRIEAEHFNYLRGIHVMSGSDDETSEIGNIRNDFYVGYSNVDFGNNLASSIEMRISKSEYRFSTVEIRLDSPIGDLIGSITVPREGDEWQTVTQEILPTDGKHNIYFVFKGMEGQRDLFKINHFRFKTTNYIYPDVTDNGGVLTASIEGHGLQNLIDNRLGTKFSASSNTGDVWIQYESPVMVAVKGYALASAEDASEKDPKSWMLQGSKDGTNWIDLDQQSNQVFAARYQKKEYAISTEEQYRYFRLNITEKNGSADDLQLAEWQIYGSSIFENDITADEGNLTAQYHGNESNETYVNVIDKKIHTKYLIKGESDLWLEYRANAVYHLSSYSITSADDAPERDPKDWILYGSQDGKVWEEIDRQTNQKFNYRQSTQIYSCDVKAGYRYFKLHITANNGSEMTQLAEWQLMGEYYFDRFYNDITMNGGELTSSAESEPNSKNLKSLIDNSGNTFYTQDASELPIWIQYKSSIPVQVRAYSIVSADDKDKDPRNWMLQGSNDGEQWTNIHTRSNIRFALRGDIKTYAVSNTDAFKYFRLNVTRLSSDADELKIAEFELHGTGISDTDITSNNGKIDSEYPGLSMAEGISRLIDNAPESKYCTNFASSAWVSYESPVPVKVTAYSITSANDNEGRDPRSWRLEASNNGVDWDVIDTRNNEFFPYRFTTQYYACNKDKHEYRYYRLNITENNGAELLQIAEWQLLDIEVDDNQSSVYTPEFDFNIDIYPNPVVDFFNITMPQQGSIQVFNTAGQLTHNQNLPQGLSTVSMRNMEIGMYIIRIKSGDVVVSKRIIKK